MPMVVNELLRNILDCQAVEALEVLWDALFLQVWWWEKTYFPELNGALSIRQVDGRFVRHGELNSKLQLPDLI